LAVSNLVVDDIETNAAVVTSGSSFYLALRILPTSQRNAMYQVYAFCRAVDDIADSGGERPARLAALEQWRTDIDACFTDQPCSRLRALAREIQAFNLQRDDFHAMIDGMVMDVTEDICTLDETMLDLYCDRVASSAGRLSVKIFGMAERPGCDLAHHLGRALQITNILRDIDADAAIHRCYLPRELLARARIAITTPAEIVQNPTLPHVCLALVERAQQHFAQADAIMATVPRAQVRAPRIMAGAYRSILNAALARGFSMPRARLRMSRARLLLIAARYALF